MDGKKSNIRTFRASKGTSKEGQITANYWKGAEKPTCIYRDDEYHRSHHSEKVKTLADRKKIIATKKFCYNYTGTGYRETDCKSKRTAKTVVDIIILPFVTGTQRQLF